MEGKEVRIKPLQVSSTTTDIVAIGKQLQGGIQRVTAAVKGQRELLQVGLTHCAHLPNSPEKNMKHHQSSLNKPLNSQYCKYSGMNVSFYSF
jgi:hypothetical protein